MVDGAKVRPLRVRPGTRYECGSNGLCCTDIHALGPVRPAERRALALIHPELVIRRPETKDLVLNTSDAGACLFLSPGGCALHRDLGPEAKPQTCQQFPFGLTATPNGGRVITSHRCPCRSYGERPEVTVAQAEAALRAGGERLRADRRVEGAIRLDGRRRISFERYEQLERALLDELTCGADPRRALGYEPFPSIDGVSWRAIGETLASTELSSRYAVALAWLGEALLACHGGRRGPWPPRPWREAFDRAEARASSSQTPHEIFGQWAADELWNLSWVKRLTLEQRRAELASLLELGYTVARAVRRQGAPADRAAAEAVTVLDLAGDCDAWLAAWA